ncbi:MAG: DEAD/DEAH box helicase [Ilumatobacteraceae bacterium]
MALLAPAAGGDDRFHPPRRPCWRWAPTAAWVRPRPPSSRCCRGCSARGWRGLTVSAVCPVAALLNNLHVRLDGYAQLVGRRAGLWHGDVPGPQRRKLLADPPDILLTTPESLEAMLVSTGRPPSLVRQPRQTVIVDEAHASLTTIADAAPAGGTGEGIPAGRA